MMRKACNFYISYFANTNIPPFSRHCLHDHDADNLQH